MAQKARARLAGHALGVVLVTLVFCRRHDISFYDIADRAVIPIAITLGFGRIANFINAEMYGTSYSGPFCVDYSANPYMRSPPRGCRHPVQLYEMLKNWMLTVVLWMMLRRWQPRPGVVFWSFIGLYGVIRFFSCTCVSRSGSGRGLRSRRSSRR